YPIATAYYVYQTLLLWAEHAITHRYQTRRRLLYFLTDCSPQDNPRHRLNFYPLLLPTIDKPLPRCPPTCHKTNLHTVDQPLSGYVRHNDLNIEKMVSAFQYLLAPLELPV